MANSLARRGPRIRDNDATSPRGHAKDTGDAPFAFWPTAAWGIGAFALSIVLHALAVAVLVTATPTFDAAYTWVASSIATLGSAAAVVLLCALHGRSSVRRDLALRLPTATALFAWLAANAGLFALIEVAGRLLHPDGGAATSRPAVEEMVAHAVVVVVAAPLFEEVLFRGFLHAGWSRSRLGVPGTILLTSALWTAVHFPASALTLTGIFVHGLLLGLARQHSGSLYVPLAMHAAHNLAIRLLAWVPA